MCHLFLNILFLFLANMKNPKSDSQNWRRKPAGIFSNSAETQLCVVSSTTSGSIRCRLNNVYQALYSK